MKIMVLLMAGLLVTWFALRGVPMAAENELTDTTSQVLLLESVPLAPDEVLATLDIVSNQGSLGKEDTSSLRVREGRVTVGKPLIYSLQEPKVGATYLSPMPNGEKWRFYLVVFRFTLHPPQGERYYRKMTFKVSLVETRTTAFQLLPERVVSKENVTQSFDLGFSICLPGGSTTGLGRSEASIGAAQTVQFTQLQPVITAFGDGESEFYWCYTGPPHMPVEPGARRTAVVLQVPPVTESLKTTILWNVELERKLFDVWRNVPVRVDALPMELALP